MGADETLNFLNSSFLPDHIQAFNPDGFQAGKNKAVNADGVKADQVILYNGNRQLHIKSNLPPGIYFVIGNNGKSILFRKKMVKLQY